MMTRKNFEEFAKIISNVKDEKIRNQLIMDFGLYFKKDNPRFNISRFSSACLPPKT